MKLYMELSAQRPIPTEVAGELLSEVEKQQAWTDFEEKRYFRLQLTLGGGVMAFHSPSFLALDLEQAGSVLCVLLDSAKGFISGKIPELLS